MVRDKVFTVVEQKKAMRILQLFGEKGRHWATGYEAEDIFGESVPVKSKEAVAWCLVGACKKFGYRNFDFLARTIDPDYKQKYKWPQNVIAKFNDADGFSPVKKVLKKIIKGA